MKILQQVDALNPSKFLALPKFGIRRSMSYSNASSFTILILTSSPFIFCQIITTNSSTDFATELEVLKSLFN